MNADLGPESFSSSHPESFEKVPEDSVLTDFLEQHAFRKPGGVTRMAPAEIYHGIKHLIQPNYYPSTLPILQNRFDISKKTDSRQNGALGGDDQIKIDSLLGIMFIKESKMEVNVTTGYAIALTLFRVDPRLADTYVNGLRAMRGDDIRVPDDLRQLEFAIEPFKLPIFYSFSWGEGQTGDRISRQLASLHDLYLQLTTDEEGRGGLAGDREPRTPPPNPRGQVVELSEKE